MANNKALILVDIQNDFCSGGALAVPEGDLVVDIANKLQLHFNLIVATKDWHPENHTSFAVNHPQQVVGDTVMIAGIEQLLWPVHCVQHSKGADFHPQLNTERIDKIFYKGIEPSIDSYSAFFDNAHQRATGLHDYLHEKGVTDVYIAGLATDYCVKYSALDAAHLGFKVFCIQDGCRAVELKPGDSARALAEMQANGVTLIKSAAV